MNRVCLVGRLGRDPEQVRDEIVRISVATVRRYNKDGSWQDETTWHNVTCFGINAKYMVDFAKKGDAVEVSGRLQGKKNGDKYFYGVVAEEVKKVGSPNGGQKSDTKKSKAQDDDLPF